MENSFKGVWIPSEVWVDKDLSIIEKIFLVQISSLDGEKGCYASNAYFSKFFDLSKTRCSNIIRVLRDKGYIKIKLVYQEGKKSIKNRIINVNKNIIMKNAGKKEKTCEVYKDIEFNKVDNNKHKNKEVQKWEEVENINKIEIDEYVKESEVGIETVKESISNSEGIYGVMQQVDEYKARKNYFKKPIYVQVIEYLNDKCKTNYKHTTSKNQKLINARMREGFTLEDFKKVINKKYKEWSNSNMEKYIRPQTLFGEKFERYLTEADMNFESIVFNNLNNKWGQASRNEYIGGSTYMWRSNNEKIKKPSKWSQGNNTENRSLTEEERKWADENLF